MAKKWLSLQGLLLTVATMYLMLMIHTHTQAGSAAKRKELNLVMILCGGKGSQGGQMASDVQRQIRQAAVMLKSAALFSKKRLHFHVLSDSIDLYSSLVNTTSGWPDRYRGKLRFSRHKVWYPEGREDMKEMFRVCATERLFIPDMFPKLDKAIYVDTDLIFMRPVEDLWAHFDNFDSQQVAAMAPCLLHYNSHRNSVPYYGDTGLNAGIMHMDLDRMREMEGGWTQTNLDMFDKYKTMIKLADQDILNILFHFLPERVYELGCQWNYRAFQCSTGENTCKATLKEGVSIIHGNALAFVKGHEMKIQKIFEAFENHNLTTDKPGKLFVQLKAGLAQVDHEDMASKCKEIPGIDKILLGQLKNHVPGARLDKRF